MGNGSENKKKEREKMRKVKSLLSILIMAVMVVGMSVTAFAQEKDSGAGGPGSLTIANASKGVVYSVYKVFDAKVSEDGTSVAYTKKSLADNPYFEKDSAGNIFAKEGAYRSDSKDQLSEGAIEWIKTNGTEVSSVTSDGSTLKFTGLPYGYYYVTSTLKDGGMIMVTSVAKDAQIVDKNSKKPQWAPEEDGNAGGKCIVLDGGRQVKANDVSIGETVHFRLQINTSNYVADKQIKEYVIEDTLPAGFDAAKITSVTIEEEPLEQFENTTFPLTIPWAVDEGENGWRNIYDTGSKIVVDYTAVLNEKAVIDGDGNRNSARFSWNYTTEEGGKSTEDFTTTDTYAIVIQKVNEKGEALTGAEFEVPFPVQAEEAGGVYTVKGGQTGTGKVKAGTDGTVVIKGLKKGDYQVTETKAPEGYNKLTEPFQISAEKIGDTKTDSSTYLDENGNVTDSETETKVIYTNADFAAKVKVVVNKSGKLLPGTGGTGEMLFTICGVLAVIVAGVVLMTAKRRKQTA